MDFKKFLEATGAFAGTSPMDGPSVAQPQQTANRGAQNPYGQNSLHDYVTDQERDGYLKNLGLAYSTGNTQQFHDLFNRASSTGRYLNNNGGRKALADWWTTIHNTLMQSSNRATTDRFVQSINNALKSRNYDYLYELDIDKNHNDGQGAMERLGNGVRDADAILRFSSNAQHSDL